MLAVEPDEGPLGAGPLSAQPPASVDADHDRAALQQQARPAAAPTFSWAQSEPNLQLHNEQALKSQTASMAAPAGVTHLRHTAPPCPPRRGRTQEELQIWRSGGVSCCWRTRPDLVRALKPSDHLPEETSLALLFSVSVAKA